MEDRQADYDKVFDFDTLFYDVFREAAGDGVLCLGPPLLNNAAAVTGATFRVPGSPTPLQAEYRGPRSEFQPSCRFRLTGATLKDADRIAIAVSGREIVVPISASGRGLFEGRRMLLALSKDNPVAWLCDWVRFNVRVNGADALLLYDNGSSLYGTGELAAQLAGIPGLASCVVVPWLFPIGPGVGPRHIQDSYYCQPGMLEHARQRYCPAARSVLNADVDELVVVSGGGRLFEHAERSGAPVLHFPGVWVEMPGSPDENLSNAVRHSDCLYGRRSQWLFGRPRKRLLRTKWIAVPSRCGDDLDWCVHNVRHATGTTAPVAGGSTGITYRHFRQINTGWKSGRARLRPYSRIYHRYDRELARALAVAFPERIQG